MDRWEDFRGPLDLGNWHNVERRIGARVPSSGIPVQLLVEGDVESGTDGSPARILEVSVTGAAVDGPTLELAVPSAVRIRYRDCESTATIRHATPTETAGVTRYGLEWGWLEEPFRSLVYGVVADARPSAVAG